MRASENAVKQQPAGDARAHLQIASAASNLVARTQNYKVLDALLMREPRCSLLYKRRHPLLLIRSREQGVKESPLK